MEEAAIAGWCLGGGTETSRGQGREALRVRKEGRPPLGIPCQSVCPLSSVHNPPLPGTQPGTQVPCLVTWLPRYGARSGGPAQSKRPLTVDSKRTEVFCMHVPKHHHQPSPSSPVSSTSTSSSTSSPLPPPPPPPSLPTIATILAPRQSPCTPIQSAPNQSPQMPILPAWVAFGLDGLSLKSAHSPYFHPWPFPHAHAHRTHTLTLAHLLPLTIDTGTLVSGLAAPALGSALLAQHNLRVSAPTHANLPV